MSTENGNAIHYRQLPPEEWQRLQPLFREMGHFFPPEYLATASVAEHHGRIVGFHVLQFACHAEPLYIAPEFTGMVNYQKLWEVLARIPREGLGKVVLPGALMITANPRVGKMAELVGFTPVEGTLYKIEWGREL